MRKSPYRVLLLLNLDFYKIFFPTGFSPNDDDKNDRLGFYGDEDFV